jgi:hypothetical protein
VLATTGEPLPLIEDGDYVGTVTVIDWTLTPDSPPGTGAQFRAELRYEAAAPLDTDAGTWVLLLQDGTEVLLQPIEPAGEDAVLGPDETRDVAIGGELETSRSPFLVYIDGSSGQMVYAIAIE